MIPIYGFLQGDTLGLLVLAQPEDSAADLAVKLQSAAAVRVAPRGTTQVLYRGQVLPPETTVLEAQMAPLDRFDVRFDARVEDRVEDRVEGRVDGRINGRSNGGPAR